MRSRVELEYREMGADSGGAGGACEGCEELVEGAGGSTCGCCVAWGGEFDP